MGKVECGLVSKGDRLLVLPNRSMVEVTELTTDTQTLQTANPGENIRITLKGIEEENLIQVIMNVNDDNDDKDNNSSNNNNNNNNNNNSKQMNARKKRNQKK